MENYRRWLDPLLRHSFEKAEANKDIRVQLRVSLALLPVDVIYVPYLQGRLLEATPEEVLVIRDALAPHKAVSYTHLTLPTILRV